MKKLKITQKRSGIGFPLRQKRTLQALGFHRTYETIEVTGTPQVLGMIAKVCHLLVVEEI
jgi:large subunit ribosomal protein L30